MGVVHWVSVVKAWDECFGGRIVKILGLLADAIVALILQTTLDAPHAGSFIA